MSSYLSHELNKALMKRIESCDYPSSQLMDRVEQSLSDPREVARYFFVLLDKLTEYPSLQLIDRLQSLVADSDDTFEY